MTATTPQSLVAALSRIRLRSVFNPYAGRCPEYDRHDAVRIRTGATSRGTWRASNR